jgi:hypothetical protein
MNRRDFLGLLAVGSVDVKAQSRMSNALAELEAAVKLSYGDVRLDIYENQSGRTPLLIHAVRA